MSFPLQSAIVGGGVNVYSMVTVAVATCWKLTMMLPAPTKVDVPTACTSKSIVPGPENCAISAGERGVGRSNETESMPIKSSNSAPDVPPKSIVPSKAETGVASSKIGAADQRDGGQARLSDEHVGREVELDDRGTGVEALEARAALDRRLGRDADALERPQRGVEARDGRRVAPRGRLQGNGVLELQDVPESERGESEDTKHGVLTELHRTILASLGARFPLEPFR